MELKEAFSNLQYLIENTQDGKKIIKFSGPFQEMNDIRKNKNRNGRVYTEKLWRKVFENADVKDRLQNRRMLAELDHPTDAGQIRRSVGIVTRLEPGWNDGIIHGTLELLNHDQGDAALVKALVEQGVQLCVSSRGAGEYLDDGCTIDPDSYRLETFDIVLDPSVSIARLEKVAESMNETTSKNRLMTIIENKVINKPPKKESKMDYEQKFIEQVEKSSGLIIEKSKVESTLAIKESVIKSLEETVKAKLAQVEKLETTLNTLNSKIEQLETAADQAADLLNTATNENKAMKEKLESYNKIEGDAIKVIESLKKTVEESKNTESEACTVIESLMKKIKEQEDAIVAKDVDIAAKDAEIEKLKDEDNDDEDPEDDEYKDEENSEEDDNNDSDPEENEPKDEENDNDPKDDKEKAESHSRLGIMSRLGESVFGKSNKVLEASKKKKRNNLRTFAKA